MRVAIKEKKYIATKYRDQRQDQNLLQYCLSEIREQSKEIHHCSKIFPKHSVKE